MVNTTPQTAEQLIELLKKYPPNTPVFKFHDKKDGLDAVSGIHIRKVVKQGGFAGDFGGAWRDHNAGQEGIVIH